MFVNQFAIVTIKGKYDQVVVCGVSQNNVVGNARDIFITPLATGKNCATIKLLNPVKNLSEKRLGKAYYCPDRQPLNMQFFHQ